MIARLCHFRRHRGGGAAIDFALTLPFLVTMIYGIIEMSRMLFDVAVLHFAVEQAARCAVVDTGTCSSAATTNTYALGWGALAIGMGLQSSDFTTTAVAADCSTTVTNKTLTTNAATAAGAFTLSFASTTGLVNGMAIADSTNVTSLPAEVTVKSFTATSVTMSVAATGSGISSGDTIKFTNPGWTVSVSKTFTTPVLELVTGGNGLSINVGAQSCYTR